MRRNIWFLLLLLSIVSAYGQNYPFPPALSDSSFIRSGMPQTYDAKTLFDYINGGADIFIDGGMDWCEVQNYSSKKGSAIELAVYKMKSPFHSFGLFRNFFEDEPIDTIQAVEHIWQAPRLNFFTSSYYYNLTFQERTIKKATAQNILLSIVKNQKPAMSKTLFFKSFPKENLIPYSEKFTHSDFLGHSFLKEVLSCSYQSGGDTLLLFTFPYPAASHSAVDTSSFSKMAGHSPQVDSQKKLTLYHWENLSVAKWKHRKAGAMGGTKKSRIQLLEKMHKSQ